MTSELSKDDKKVLGKIGLGYVGSLGDPHGVVIKRNSNGLEDKLSWKHGGARFGAKLRPEQADKLITETDIPVDWVDKL